MIQLKVPSKNNNIIKIYFLILEEAQVKFKILKSFNLKNNNILTYWKHLKIKKIQIKYKL